MAIITHRSLTRFSRCQAQFDTPNMRRLLADIESFVQCPVKVLKDDETSTVVVVEVDNQYLVVKRLNTKSKLHFLRRLFAPSRAKKNWVNANLLQAAGVKTFTPIAYLEERWGMLKRRSYFICSYIQGVEALRFFDKRASHESYWLSAANKIGALCRRLTHFKISHRDLNLSNIILVKDEPWLIDLDGMCQHRWHYLARRSAVRERKRFLQNCRDMPNVSLQSMSLIESCLSEKNTEK